MTLKPALILLAEDNAGDVFLVRRALAQYDVLHELLLAKDGEEALRLLDEGTRRPDLLLLDLNLPRLEGSQILAQVKSKPETAKVPVIILTSSDSPRERDRALALGASTYFRKPTDLQAFMRLGSLVRDLLQSEPSPA
jgi:CheY-like chemotaxis protein